MNLYSKKRMRVSAEKAGYPVLIAGMQHFAFGFFVVIGC